jgi:hypothetical protein
MFSPPHPTSFISLEKGLEQNQRNSSRNKEITHSQSLSHFFLPKRDFDGFPSARIVDESTSPIDPRCELFPWSNWPRAYREIFLPEGESEELQSAVAHWDDLRESNSEDAAPEEGTANQS